MVFTLGSPIAATQTVPQLFTQMEQFGKGLCGDYSLSLTKADGSDCSSFITIDLLGTITLQTSDPGLTGIYTINLTA